MEIDIEQRKAKILEMLNNEGNVKVSELSKLFNISEVTIRIDLQDLESKGLLQRVHGGAVGSYKTYYDMSLKQRSSTNESEKKAIAAKAASMINDNDTVMINSGTTTLFTIRAMSALKNINIVTNSIDIALEASTYKEFNIIMLGGSINSKYQYTYGADAINQLSLYHANKLILSVDGVSGINGYSTYYSDEAEISRRMIAQSDTTIVVADYTKIGRTAFTQISPLNVADHLVTNNKSFLEDISTFSDLGIDLVLV